MHQVFVLQLMLFIVTGFFFFFAGEQKKQRLFPGSSSQHTIGSVQGLKQFDTTSCALFLRSVQVWMMQDEVATLMAALYKLFICQNYHWQQKRAQLQGRTEEIKLHYSPGRMI